MDLQKHQNNSHQEQHTSQASSSNPLENMQTPKPALSRELGSSSSTKTGNLAVKYLECMKNHATEISSHATDGCGEFMPAGEEGSLDALKCAACNCHRSFHRKIVEDNVTYQVQLQTRPQSHYYHGPPPAKYLHVSPVPRDRVVTIAKFGDRDHGEKQDILSPATSVRVKRFRTKFTSEQKNRMLSFAERIGWKIKKEDEAATEEFCGEIGVSRDALKVWLQNNKNTIGKKV